MKRFSWLLVISLLAGLVGPSPAAVAVPAAVPASIAQSLNFRDVAGAGLPLASGGTMAVGLVYRSAKLAGMTAEDVAQLEALGITDVFDLRSRGAARAQPDPSVAGATNHVIDLFAGRSIGSGKVRTAAQARAHMRQMNRRFVTVAAQRRHLATVLRGIANAEGPVIIHCAHGKDRTGWVSAMLQYIAGVRDTDIVAQYLLSNDYRATEIKAKIAKASASRKGVVRDLETVRGSYLKAGLAQARRQYRTIHRYLTKGVGLSATDYASLKSKLQGV